WSLRLIVTGWSGGAGFATGWRSAFDSAVSTALLILLLSAPLRIWTAIAIAILAASDYQAFGVNRRFNAMPGPYQVDYATTTFPTLDPPLYELMRSRPEYRVALDLTAPFPQQLRHVKLATPQGFDPFLPERYKELIEQRTPFRTNRLFDLPPEDGEFLQLV